jgi:hypothetical protein
MPDNYQNNITTLAKRLKPFLMGWMSEFIQNVYNNEFSGELLKNIIYRFDYGTEAVVSYEGTDSGLSSALSDAGTGDIVWVLAHEISGLHTVPAGVGLVGLGRDRTILTGRVILEAGSSLSSLTVDTSGEGTGGIAEDDCRLDYYWEVLTGVEVSNDGRELVVSGSARIDVYLKQTPETEGCAETPTVYMSCTGDCEYNNCYINNPQHKIWIIDNIAGVSDTSYTTCTTVSLGGSRYDVYGGHTKFLSYERGPSNSSSIANLVSIVSAYDASTARQDILSTFSLFTEEELNASPYWYSVLGPTSGTAYIYDCNINGVGENTSDGYGLVEQEGGIVDISASHLNGSTLPAIKLMADTSLVDATIITSDVRMDPVVGVAEQGDQGIWDVSENPDRHASDIPGDSIYHLPDGADVDDVPIWDGSKWLPGPQSGGGGAVDAADVTYTPLVNTDWDGDADPGDVDNALDQLAERVDDLEGVSPTVDAGDVTYTPTTLADWDSDADPGDVDNALDQLAERVDDLEGIAPGTDVNAVHVNEVEEIYGVTLKETPADDDVILIEDSAAGYVKKRIKISSIVSTGGAFLTASLAPGGVAELIMTLVETAIEA